jgi:hypothetical protein
MEMLFAVGMQKAIEVTNFSESMPALREELHQLHGEWGFLVNWTLIMTEHNPGARRSAPEIADSVCSRPEYHCDDCMRVRASTTMPV